MKRYIRIFPRRIEVGGLEFTPHWQQVDVTADQLACIEACGQLEVSATRPNAPAELMTAAELAAEAAAGTLIPGGLYLSTDDEALNVATSSTTYISLAVAE
jgi:hypothetical protein